MTRIRHPALRLALAATAFGAGLLLAAPRAAQAQATATVSGGLSDYYRSESWVPVRVTLTNQGAPAKVEVRARFFSMGKGVEEYRIPERELPSSHNSLHTLYMRSPRSYGAQPLTVDLYKDGRLLNTIRPQFRLVPDENWLVYAVGPQERTTPLNILSTARWPARRPQPGMPASSGGQGRTAQVSVATSETGDAPDRWQGLEAADAVVLAGVSERDFKPEQLTAIREYAAAGGTVVVTGGLNWNRLTSAWFRDLLPVRVTGSTSLSGLAVGGETVAGSIPILTADPREGARVTVRSSGHPLVVEAPRGAGRVVFLAFDPSLAPLREWSRTPDLWLTVLGNRPKTTLLDSISAGEDVTDPYGGLAPLGYYRGTGTRLADAPFAIPQLDIPAFYVVALFLLAYVIILVPVNYFFLKAKDKKEYAWLTTPAIVLLFSVGAYLIGYGSKGGSTLAVRVGVIEAYAGQSDAPFLFYSGIFSPRKTGYDIKFAAANAAQDPFSNALFTEPEANRSQAGLRLTQDDQMKIEDFAVDMWAMRVLKAEGVTNLGKGFAVRKQGQSLTVRNDTPYALESCSLVTSGEVTPIGNLGPGGEARLTPLSTGGSAGTTLPADLIGFLQGETKQARMRRTIIQSLTGANHAYSAPPATTAGDDMRLVGWLTQPVGTLSIDGRSPKETAETLVVLHLGS